MSSSMKNTKDHENIPMTIEMQLESYTRFRNSTPRHHILWHAWNHSKEWIKNLLSWTLPSFPTYSLHDVSHAASVLHNIEMLLGEDTIRKLSASDCFIILHMVYIHDIGMCITSDYRKKLMTDPKFLEFLNDCRSDIHLREYADILLANVEDGGKDLGLGRKGADKDNFQMELKLNVYYAVMHLVAERKRSEHAKDSQRLLNGWIRDENKLGAGFSTSGIAKRFFYCIGNCASLHSGKNFEDVLLLPKSDSGYAGDYIHPRFAAILLQLGDSLDMDNDRFHPLMQEFVEKISETTEIHIGKHESIRKLLISPIKIEIQADCSKAKELRVVQSEYEGIQNILLHASGEWASICPKEIGFILPRLKPLDLRLNGNKISADLANIKFDIQQDKAFNLLQGSNFYHKSEFVFLREIYQNAVDATKLQYWRDWKGSRWNTQDSQDNEVNIKEKIRVSDYPIEIDFYIAGKKKYSREYRPIKDQNDFIKFKTSDFQVEYGVLVQVKDYGTGMTDNDIKETAKVGTSYRRSEKKPNLMPEWLRPTGEFGVGLQSVFLVSESFKAYSHVRHGAQYEIEFNATGEKKNGYINVTPLEEGGMQSYGTKFEVFVSVDGTKFDLDVMGGQGGNDPFRVEEGEEGPDKARNLIVKMLLYLDEIVGKPMFPVKIRLHEYKEIGHGFRRMLGHEDLHLDTEIYVGTAPEPVKMYGSNFKDETAPEKWKTVAQCRYFVDWLRGNLHIVQQSIDVIVSAKRLINLSRQMKHPDKTVFHPHTKIYYRGIYVTEMDFHTDMGMMEEIDIKGGLKREHIALNRSEFTEQGTQYIRETIYPELLQTVWKCLNQIADDKDEIIFNRDKLRLKEILQVREEENISLDNVKSQILFMAGLGTLHNTLAKNSFALPVSNPRNKEKTGRWNAFLDVLGETVKELKKNQIQLSVLFKLNVHQWDGKSGELGKSSERTVIDIIHKSLTPRCFAVVSYRKESSANWEGIFVEIGAAPVQGKGEHGSDTSDSRILSEQSETTEKSTASEDNWPDVIEKRILSLKVEPDEKKRSKLIDEIDGKLAALEMVVRKWIDIGTIDVSDMAQRKSEHKLQVWIMQHMPCLAMYSSADKKIRINIIDYVPSDSIYQSRLLIREGFEKMEKLCKDEKRRRFSMVTGTSFCQLGLKKPHDGTCFVKRGKLSWVGKRDLIVPLTGKAILCLIKRSNDSIASIILGILECLEKELKENEELQNSIVKKINEKMISKPKFKEIKNSIEQLTGCKEQMVDSKEQRKDGQDMIIKVKSNIHILLNSNEYEKLVENSIPLIAAIQDEIIFKEYLWRLLNEESEQTDEFRKVLDESYFCISGDCKLNDEMKKTVHQYKDAKKRLIQYVAYNSWWHHLEEFQVEEMYKVFIHDMLRCLEEPLLIRRNALNERYIEIFRLV